MILYVALANGTWAVRGQQATGNARHISFCPLHAGRAALVREF